MLVDVFILESLSRCDVWPKNDHVTTQRQAGLELSLF
jgi:hypothetical protein